MRWPFPGAVVALTLSGCTLLVDTSDLANGQKPVDAGGPSGDADGAPLPDAGTSDAAGAADAAEAGIAPAACPPDAILCEDFENGLGKFDVHTTNGSVDIATDIVHRGGHALRSTSNQTTATTGTTAEARFVLPKAEKSGGTFYFRVYVYLATPMLPDTTLSKWRTTGATTDDINLKIDPEGRFKIDADLASEGPELSGSHVAPVGKWLCVDWKTQLGAPGHELLKVDGVTEIDKDENNVPPDGYVNIAFGFAAPDKTTTMTVLFDDVILSNTPVGCP